MPTQKNRTYGSPMDADEPISTGRPTAGPADDATVSKSLKTRLSEREPAPAAKSPSNSVGSSPPAGDSSDFAKGVDYLTHPKKYEQDIDKAVDDSTK